MMANERSNDWEDVYEIPQNKTLYVDQFTIDGPSPNEIRRWDGGTSIEKVFNYYKPQVDIELRNDKHELVRQSFLFNSIDDFEDECLISKSFLAEEEWIIETYQGIVQQLERNNALRDAFNDEATRHELKKLSDRLLSELGGGPRDNTAHPGFQLLKGVVNGIENMDPSHMAQKAIFLDPEEQYYSDARHKLTKELEIWQILFNYETTLSNAIASCMKRCAEIEQCLQSNLLTIHDSIHDLEVTYRTMDSFYAHMGGGDYNVIIMNVNKKELKVPDSFDTTAILGEMKQYYDRIELKDSYSLLVIPGYLGDASTIREWAKAAYKNRVLLITDFKDIDDFLELKKEIKTAHLQDSDVALANVIMTCNYILGRKKSVLADEKEDLFFPASGALAGRMTNTEEIPISQGVVGMEYGTLSHLKGTRINLLKSDVAVLIEYGLIPIVEEDGHTIAYSNRTLNNSSSASLHEYPIIRVFDWIKKVLMNYMHGIAFNNWDPYKSSQQLKERIQGFLNHIQGYQFLFSDYRLGEPVQDPKTKEVTVNLSITPYYVGKKITIKLKADEKKLQADTEIEQPN